MESETPTIITYASNYNDLLGWQTGEQEMFDTIQEPIIFNETPENKFERLGKMDLSIWQGDELDETDEEIEEEKINEMEGEMAEKRRYVSVYVVDPDVSVPVEKCLLHKEPARMTELTDTELYFEIDIKTILEKHNAMRITLTDKTASAKMGKDIYLEPVRIRDLKMVVSVHAEF